MRPPAKLDNGGITMNCPVHDAKRPGDKGLPAQETMRGILGNITDSQGLKRFALRVAGRVVEMAPDEAQARVWLDMAGRPGEGLQGALDAIDAASDEAWDQANAFVGPLDKATSLHRAGWALEAIEQALFAVKASGAPLIALKAKETASLAVMAAQDQRAERVWQIKRAETFCTCPRILATISDGDRLRNSLLAG